MNPTYDDWQKSLEPAKAERAEEHRGQLEMLAQAEVKAADLTGDPVWDRFLSYVQAAIEATEAQRAGFAAAIADPATVDHDRIMVSKINMAQCQGRIDAWNSAISLPTDIIKMGKEARTLLDRMPKAAA